MEISLDEAVKFTKRNLLTDWDELAIRRDIGHAIETYAFGYTRDENGLTGICFGYWLCNGEGIHIVGVFGSLRAFINYLKTFFPQCKFIRAVRVGENITYLIGKDL